MKTKKRTTKKNANAVRLKSTKPSPATVMKVETTKELMRRVGYAEQEAAGAKLDAKAARTQNQKLEARLFLLGAANMYLAERLVKAATMIERGIRQTDDPVKTARVFDDVVLFCKGMI